MANLLEQLRKDNPSYSHYSDKHFIRAIAEQSGMSFDDVAARVGYSSPKPVEPASKEAQRPSGFTGMLGNVVRGAKQAGRSIGAMGNTITGDLTAVEDYARRSQESAEKEMPEEQRQLHSELQAIDREQGAMGQIGDTLGAAARNPMGTAQLITEQIPNSAVSLGSGWAGFKTGAALGAAAGPVGAGIGGTLGFLGGMFLGNYMLEGGSKAVEKAEGGFTPEEREEVLREAPIKAGVVTLTDALTFKAGSMIANRLGGAAAVKNGAKAEAEVLMKAGVDMSSPATINAALAKSPKLMKQAKIAGERAAINTLSRSKKAGIAGTGLSLETVGEGAGEYLGEMAATGEGDVVDATIEALAGFSQSAVQTVYNYNRLGNKLDPENIRRQAEEINQAKTQEGINNIANAETVDEAIQAAADTAAQKPVTPGDVMDDIAYREELLKRTEDFTQGEANEETQQETITQPVQAAEVLGSQPEGLGQQGQKIIDELASTNNPLTETELTQEQPEQSDKEKGLFSKPKSARDTEIIGKLNSQISALEDIKSSSPDTWSSEDDVVLNSIKEKRDGIANQLALSLETSTNNSTINSENRSDLSLRQSSIPHPDNIIGIDAIGGSNQSRSSNLSESIGDSSQGDSKSGSNLNVTKAFISEGDNSVSVDTSGRHKPSSDPASVQKIADSTVRNSKHLTDLVSSKSFIDKGFDGLNREDRRSMVSSMVDSIQDDKIRDEVIAAIPVPVMNMLRSLKLDPKMLLHNPSMLQNINSIVNSDTPVPSRVDVTGSIAKTIASLITKEFPSLIIDKSRGGDLDGGVALGTIDGDRHNFTPNSKVDKKSEGALTSSDSPIIPQNQSDTPEAERDSSDSPTQQSQARPESQRDPQERSGQGQKDERLIPVSKRGELNTNDSKEVFARFAELGSDLNTADQAVIDAEEITGLHLGLTVRKTRLDPGVPARFILSERVIEVSDNWNYERWKGAQFIAEEILHAVDSVGDNKTLSASSVRLNLKNGDIALEAKRIHDSNSIYRKFLDYPLGIDYKDLSDTQKQAELFARLGVLYFGEPEKMRQILPIAYGAFNEIFMVSTHPVTREVHRKIWTTPDRNIEVRTRHGSGRQDDVSDRRVVEGRENSELGRLRESIGAHFEADPRGAKVTFNRSRTDDRLIPLSERNKNDGVNENNVDYNDRQSDSSDKINEGVEDASTNQRKSSYNPNNLSLDLGTRNLDLDYGEIEQRPGTTEKQREIGNRAFRDLVRSAQRMGGSLLAANIAKDFKEQAGSVLIGRTAETPQDLAVLAQVLRDPRFETFRIFFVKNGRIVHHTGITSRLPGSVDVVIQEEGETAKQAFARFIANINNQMKASEADGYYLLHNHPSGRARASTADIQLTKQIAANLPGFRSHVIIDHNEYGEISVQELDDIQLVDEKVHKVVLTGGYSGESSLPHNVLQATISNAQELAGTGKHFEQSNEWFTLVGRSANGRVVSIAQMPMSALKKPDLWLLGALRRFARSSGATRLMAVTEEHNLGRFENAVLNGVLLDVASSDGSTSLRQRMQTARDDGLFGAGKRKAIQVKQDDMPADNILRGTQAEKTKSLSVEEVKQAVNPLRARLLGSIKINVVQSTNDIPSRVHERSVEDSVPIDTDGVYDPAEKTVYLIADNIPSAERALWVALHETVGHAGLRSLGKDVQQTITYASKNKFVADLGRAIAKDRQQDYDAIHHNEEAIAELSAALLSDNVDAILNRYGIVVPENARKNLDGIIERVVEAIRRFVSNMMGKVTDNQIRELVMAAKVAVEGGRIESGKAANDYMRESLRLIRNGYRTVNDFIIPETPEYADNFTGDLAHVPENKQIPSGPLRVSVGAAFDRHRGFGLKHIADNAIREKSRMPNRAAGDLAEDLMRNVVAIMRGIKNGYFDGQFYIFENPSMNRSIVAKYADGYYSVITEKPQKYGASDKSGWRGHLTLPRIDDSATSPSPASRQSNESPNLDRLGLEGTTREKFNIPESNEKGQDKKRPVVTAKKKRNYDLKFSIINNPDVKNDRNMGKHDIRLFTGSPENIEEIKDDGVFGGIFATTDKDSAASHGENIHVIDINSDDIADSLKLSQDINILERIKHYFPDATESEYDSIYDVIINESSLFNSDIDRERISDLFVYEDIGEADWYAQRIRGQIAKDLGYKAVEMKDEHGKSYLVLPGVEIKAEDREAGENLLFSRAQTLANAGVNTTTTQAGKASTTLPEETKFQAFRRKTQDAMLRFKLVQEWLNEQGVNLTEAANVYQRENISKGKTANLIENFRNKELEPLIKDIAEAKFELGDIATYLEARHIPEANARMRQIHNDPNATANGITDQQAQKVLADFQAMPNFREFEKLAGRVWNIGQETLDMRLNAGLISQEQYDAYKNTYKNWVPLRGNVNPQGFGKGLSTSHKDKRRMGHGFREDEFVLENLVQDRERAIMQVEKNKVSLSVLEFLMQANNPEIGTVGKPQKRATIKDHSYAVEYKGQVVGSFENKGAADSAVLKILNGSSNLQLPGVASILPQDLKVVKTYDPRVVMMARPQLEDNEIQAMINGSSVRMQLNDPLLARAGTAAGIEQVGSIIHAAREFNRFLSKAYTAFNPEFVVTNVMRDLYSGTIVLTGKRGAKFVTQVMQNYFPSIRDLWRARNDPSLSPWVERYRKAGGNVGASWLPDIERIGEDAMKALQEYAGARETYRMVYSEQIANGASKTKAKTIAIAKAGTAKLRAIPVFGKLFRVIERVNAVAENSLRLAAFRTAIENGESDQQAAFLSKETINFNRHGEINNTMSALWLFYNPAAQSIQLTGEALFSSKHKAQVWSLVGALTTLSFLLAEIGRGDDDDDEREYQNIPDYVKDRNLVFKFGDIQFTLAVAYGWGWFHTAGRLLSDYMHGEDGEKIAVKLAASFVENFSPMGNPVDEGDNETQFVPFQLLPTVAKIAVGPSVNLNSMGREIHPRKFSDSQPDSQLASRSVRGTIYQDLADFLNDATGGSKYEPGRISVSPDTIKFMVTSITGGAGKFVSDTVTGTMGVANGIAPTLKDTPIVRRFVRESGVEDSRAAFWKTVKEVKSASERYNRALRDGDIFYAQNAIDTKQRIIALAEYANKYSAAAAMERDAILDIQKGEDMTKKEKSLRIKEIEIAERRLYDDFLRMFDVAKKIDE